MKIANLTLRNNLVLAPMAGITDLPFRRLTVGEGCGLVVSEMISAKGLLMGGNKTISLLESSPDEKPLAVQLFGADPDTLAEAAIVAEGAGADIIDINMGCPVKKVVGTGAGSALLRDPLLIDRIISCVKKAIKIPLTIKIRAGWDHSEIVAPDVLKAAEACGADALIIHARTRSQGFSGKADWDLIKELKNRAAIPVIGNGDVSAPEDADRMIKETGCDGVMIGRGALGNPWIFSQALSYMDKGQYELPSPEKKREKVIRHLNLIIEKYGEKKGLRIFRKHLAWYSKAMRDSASFRQEINASQSFTEVEAMISSFFSTGNIEPLHCVDNLEREEVLSHSSDMF